MTTLGEATAVKAATSADKLRCWKMMVTLRAYDERAVVLQRHGRIGAYPLFWGEEAIQAAAVTAVRESDWLFISYRQNAIPVLRGLPPEQALAYFRGDPQSFFDPALYRCAPQCVPLATHLPHAVGWAMGRRLQGSDSVGLGMAQLPQAAVQPPQVLGKQCLAHRRPARRRLRAGPGGYSLALICCRFQHLEGPW